MGVRRFPTLPYAHKPGVATYLNAWSWEFAAGVPEVIWSGTFYPEPEAPAYVADLVDAGVEIFKLHLQVGEFHLDDPRLDRVWGVLEDAGTPVVVHAARGRSATPSPGRRRRAGAGRAPAARPGDRAHGCAGGRGVPATWPSTTTTSGSTPRWCSPTSSRRTRASCCRGSPTSATRSCSARTSRPSRTPTRHQLESLARLDLGDDWLRQVCWENGAALFGSPAA